LFDTHWGYADIVKMSKHDLAALDTSFAAITDLATQLSKQHKKGQHEAGETSTALLKVKDEVQSSVRDWAKGVSEKSTRMVGELLEHQQEHLSIVRSMRAHSRRVADVLRDIGRLRTGFHSGLGRCCDQDSSRSPCR
jgi:hypothetical protein